MRLFVFIVFFLISSCGSVLLSQSLLSIHTRWDDSFLEWEFYTEDEREGSLSLRWPNRNDWSEWSYRFEDVSGVLKMKWTDNPNQWELRGNNEVINIRTRWSNDFTEWKFSNGETKLTLKSKYTNELTEWYVVKANEGDFLINVENFRDPRDWQIYDELDQNVSFEFKLAMVFIAIINSSPKV